MVFKWNQEFERELRSRVNFIVEAYCSHENMETSDKVLQDKVDEMMMEVRAGMLELLSEEDIKIVDIDDASVSMTKRNT
jgi:hypothetical protein